MQLLEQSAMQLLEQSSPISAALVAVMVMWENTGLGSSNPGPDTIIGFPYSFPLVVAITISALLGLLVSLFTFLVIGTTSSLTYNVSLLPIV